MTDCWPGCTYDCCLNRGGWVTYPGQGAVGSTDEMVWLLRARADEAQAKRESRARNPETKRRNDQSYRDRKKLKGTT